MNCGCSPGSICPCGQFIHPATVFNAPGLDVIAYRVGDYTTFREALLRALPGETALTCADPANPGQVVRIWRPGAEGDLAVQMIEWWAYLADILTFYNERVATQAYLGTADQSITVNRLVRLLGYRPKPGIGATGSVAALLNGTTAATIPQGYQIQSKPGPGRTPQIFEVSAATVISAPDAVAIAPMSALALSDGNGLLLTGTATGLKANQSLLLVARGWTGAANSATGVTVKSTATEQDPVGNNNTRVTVSAPSVVANLPAGALAANYRLLASSQTARLWSFYDTGSLITSSGAELSSIYRQIQVGDPVWITGTSPTSGTYAGPASVTSYAESIWYANAAAGSPTVPPAPATTPGIPVPHSTLGLRFPPGSSLPWDLTPGSVVVAFAFQDVGTLIGTPSLVLTSSSYPLINPAAPVTLPVAAQSVLIEDADGNGVNASAPVATAAGAVVQPAADASTAGPLYAPARTLFNLLPVTRGKTVANEVLGAGNAAVGGQDFTLKQTPVTYLQDGSSRSGENYSSTVQVWVNQVQWTEVPTFYNALPSAQIFRTKDDEQGNTHVIFGDGQNGARLPTGASVVANYRYGSGAAVPAAGTLTVVLKPLPALNSIRNPVPVGGGGDPDPPDQVRAYAPRSVVTFGRAVSLDDFALIAGNAPGVTLAQAVYAVNRFSQRPQIQVFVVPGTAAAVQSAQTALSDAADPNRLPAVLPAVARSIAIHATLVLNAGADPAAVLVAATAALTGLFEFDPNSGTSGVFVLGIGQPLFDSQVYSALQVPGVQAVENYACRLAQLFTGHFLSAIGQRHDPSSGHYFALALSNLHLATDPAAPAS